MDTGEKLHLLLKKNIAEVKLPEQSLMPVSKLSPAQANDLVAFLKTAPEIAQQPWKPSADLNVSATRLENAEKEPGNWLTYWGDLWGTHYSRLSSINTTNVGKAHECVGIPIRRTTGGNDAIGSRRLTIRYRRTKQRDGARCAYRQTIWRYQRRLPTDIHTQCTVMTNRGLAILGDRRLHGNAGRASDCTRCQDGESHLG